MKPRPETHPGARDRVITIQQRSATDAVDATSGEPVETWSTLVANMPAAKVDVSGWERFQGQQLSARFDQRWVINYRADMDQALVDVPKLRRIVVDGRTHEIVHSQEIGRREGIELLTLAASGI